MKRLNCEITIGDNVINFITEVQIQSSWKEFTDKCILNFPKRITKNGEPIFVGVDSLFKKGDRVTVKLGYYPNLVTRFEGYINQVHVDSPVVIECHDEFFKLKQNTLTKSYKTVSLDTLLNDITGDVEFESISAELGSFRISNVTPAQVIEELKKVYLLDAFIKENKLRVGLQYIPDLSTNHVIVKEKQIIDDDLEYQKEEDVRIRIKAVSMLPDNTKIEEEVGDVTGEVRTAYYYNLTRDELIAAANRELPKFRYTGFRVSFTTFGEPFIQHGDTIEFSSKKFPEYNGKYFVDSVTTNFGQNGFRQKVELGRKAE